MAWGIWHTPLDTSMRAGWYLINGRRQSLPSKAAAEHEAEILRGWNKNHKYTAKKLPKRRTKR